MPDLRRELRQHDPATRAGSAVEDSARPVHIEGVDHAPLSDPDIEQQLEAIRARLCAAPAGPWEVWDNTHRDPIVVEAGRGPFRAIANCSTRTEDYGRAIAQLIAAAPTDLEMLLGLCDQLLAENARLRTGAL